MSSSGIGNVQHLHLRVLDGCSRRDFQTITAALRTLIRKSRRSHLYAQGYVQLYRLCMVYLKLGKIGEIRTIFDRLAAQWITALTTLTARHRTQWIHDVEMTQVSEQVFSLWTSDSVIAVRLRNIRGVRLDTLERLPSGEFHWNMTVRRRSLPRVLSLLRQPQYLEFLDRNYSEQLSLEF